jgi:hypothetical protein
MSMDRDTLRADLKASLHDAADAFTDPDDFDRFLDRAAQDLPRRRPLTLTAEITLKANQNEYTPVPADLVHPVFTRWANGARLKRSPWVANYPPARPRVTLVNQSDGQALLVSPLPTASELAEHGETLQYDYEAQYTIGDQAADTTVRAEDRWLLLLRAQAEACKELALKNIDRPVQVGSEGGSPSANGTPAGLHERLMKEFKAA